MYHLEVKRWLVAHRFRPEDGWLVHIDAMEKAKGADSSVKAEVAAAAEDVLRELGAEIGAHQIFGVADIVATHPEHGCFMVEVEGESSRQKEQALYSDSGELILQAHGAGLCWQSPVSLVGRRSY